MRGTFKLFLTAWFFATACEQVPTALEQEVVDVNQGSGNAAVDETPQETPEIPEETPEETPADEVPAEGDAPVAALSFAEFDVLAQENCGGCHADGSGRTYIVGVEQNAIDNSVGVSARIKDTAAPMPPAGLLDQAIIDQMDSYLNSVQ